MLAGQLQRELLGGRVADRNDVARIDRLRQRCRPDFRAKAVPAMIHAPVFPGRGAAHLGVGAVADAELVAVAAIRLGDDADRHFEIIAIAISGQHLDRREILAVVERELRAQQLGGVERFVFPITQVAAHQRIVDRVLRDRRVAEVITRAGFEGDLDLGGVRLWIDAHFIAQHARIEVTVVRGGAQQVALEGFVGGVIEPFGGPHRRIVRDVRENLVRGAGPGHLHVDFLGPPPACPG